MVALIEFVVILVAALIFVLSNQQSSCDISLFGLYTFHNEPVYVISLVSFILGIGASIPFFLFFILKKKSKGKMEIKRRKKGEIETEYPIPTPESQD
ncbi:MAG: hypothetical protein LBE74_09495 [Treponema sp.]|jgi:uncharacterized integral membrane protein|nr:hypothetical protein [Treponema sp.]